MPHRQNLGQQTQNLVRLVPGHFVLASRERHEPMNVRLAKKNPVAGVRTFTVTSESEPDTKYVVVEVKRDGTTYYCNCPTFSYRHLPFIGTNLFSLCKHGQAVREAIGK
jgi:hypothetical protein